MSTPVVVHGTSIGNPYAGSSQPPSGNWTKGERQPTKCRDPIFAVLFYINLGAILGVAAILGSDSLQGQSTSTGNIDFTGYMYAVFITGTIAIILSFLMMLVMMRIPTLLIKVSLIFVVALSGVWAAIAFVTGNFILGIIGFIFFALGVCYAWAVWSRIPFASANLLTATSAIRNNCGVTLQAIFFVVLAFGWSLLWVIALLGIWDSTGSCTTTNGVETCSDPNYGIMFVLFISYFFTHQVIQNTLQVVVAGVVGELQSSHLLFQTCFCSKTARPSYL